MELDNERIKNLIENYRSEPIQRNISMSCVFVLQIIYVFAMSNQGVLDFGMQVLEASLSPLPSACRILKFDNVSV